MITKRLKTIEEKATRYFTTGEVLGMLRTIFIVVEATVSSREDRDAFKEAVITQLSPMMEIEVADLRDYLL